MWFVCGYVHAVDTANSVATDKLRMVHLLRVTSNNLNQYAKRANENGSIYAADIQDLQQRLDNLWSVCKDILAKLAVIK